MEYIKVTISLDPTPMKPQTNEERAEWSRNLGSAPAVDLTIEELAEVISELHHSFCHATFSHQWIARKNFRQSQLIVLDIDNGLSPQQAIDRCDKLDLPRPNIIYRTFSDSTDSSHTITDKLALTKKFRMIFVLVAPIHDLKEYELLVKSGIYILFPEADRVGVTQKWLGGQETIYMDTEARLSPTTLMCIVDVYDARKIGQKGRKKRFTKKYSTAPPNIFHDGSKVDLVPDSAKPLYIYIKNQRKKELN